jgi:hypothetical protein
MIPGVEIEGAPFLIDLLPEFCTVLAIFRARNFLHG